MFVSLVDRYDFNCCTTHIPSYADSNLCLTVNLIFAEILRYESLVKVMLDVELFCPFFKLIQSENFDIATNAFNTFKVGVLVLRSS